MFDRTVDGLKKLASKLIGIVKIPKVMALGLALIWLGITFSLFAYFYQSSDSYAAPLIDQTVSLDNLNSADDSTADPTDVIDWRKQIDLNPEDTEAQTSVIEKIPEDHDYQSGSINLPPGWKVEYSTKDNPTSESDWTSTEPANAANVRNLRISTETVSSTKPVAQEAITKPLDQEALTEPAGVTGTKTLAALSFENKVFTIFRAVDVEDGSDDGNELTIGCLDLTDYEDCRINGVTFPTYMSSASNTDLGGKLNDGVTDTPKDISTPETVRAAFDDGTHGNEGYWYIPAQSGDDYGINCIDLKNARNCGFTVVGTAPAPSQDAGHNPTLISGFSEVGSRLYGHTNPFDGDTNYTNDFIEIFCFDMSTGAFCADYSTPETTPFPSLYRLEHDNSFYTPSQHIVHGDQYFFIMNYDEGNHRLNTASSTVYTQTAFGNRLVCYDIALKAPCAGWASVSHDVNLRWYCPSIFNCPGFISDSQMVYGSLLSEGIPVSPPLIQESPHQMYISKDSGLNPLGICVTMGALSGVDPGTRCHNFSDGVSNATLNPPSFIPNIWLNVPWTPAFNILEHDNKIYTTWDLSKSSVFGLGEKTAMLCYDWAAQDYCSSGFRTPHYWHEINNSNALDTAYIFEEKCVIGVSANNFLWSFDTETGESPCRNLDKTVEIEPSLDLSQSYCDGNPRSAGWGYLQLDNASEYDFRTFNLTIRDKNGTVVGAFNDVDLKNLSDFRLDLSSINFSGNTDELQVEVESQVLNTAPWGDDPDTVEMDRNIPYISVVMDADSAQYCYETKVKPYCDIASVTSTSNISATTKFDLLSREKSVNVPVNQEPDEQCFKDLQISVDADKEEVSPGDTLTFSINVFNKANNNAWGRGIVTGSAIEATIPEGVSVVATSSGATVNGNKVRWDNQSVGNLQNKVKTLTLLVEQSDQTTSLNPLTTFASTSIEQVLGTTSTPLVLSAAAIFGDDVYQADNTVTYSNVNVIATDGEFEGGSPGADPTGDQTQPYSPVETTEDRPDSFINRGTYTPGFIEDAVPGPFKNIVETIFKTLDSIVAPIPPGVAAAIPYSLIALLAAFALIYVYEAIQEARIRHQFQIAREKFKRTEQLRKNYLDLTSHYLKTPITTMKSSIELIDYSQTDIDPNVVDDAKLDLSQLGNHVMMLEDDSDYRAQKVAQIAKPVLKSKYLLFSKGVILPIFGVFTVVFLINALFIWTDKYGTDATVFIIQMIYFALTSIALFVAFNVYKNQRTAKTATEQELENESQLAKRQSDFIEDASALLTTDVNKLGEVAPTISQTKMGRNFSDALDSLRTTVSKLSFINRLTKDNIGKSSFQVDVNQLISEEILRSQSDAGKKKISVESSISPGLKSSVASSSLEQLLSSVINNAIKYTPEGGNIKIEAKNIGSKIEIKVIDSGKGMTKKQLESAFSPFGNITESTDQTQSGLGLDLYIDHLITDQVGGSIEVNSVEGQGTTVQIELPS